MRKLITSGLVALTAAASLAATAAPASADPWHGGHDGWRGGDHDGWRGGPGWGIAAGLAAFGLTAAIASSQYHGPYYGHGYYYDGPGPGPATCVGTRRVWDPYYGGYVMRRFYYAC